jgi:hypothetical protein
MKTLARREQKIKLKTYDHGEDNSEKKEEEVVVAVASDLHFGGQAATACKIAAAAAGKLAPLSRFGTRLEIEGFFGLVALG